MAIYNGISGKNCMTELLNLKVKDVNLNKKTITLPDRTIIMDEMLEKATRETIEQKILFAEIRKGAGKGKEDIDLNMESIYVLKIRPS